MHSRIIGNTLCKKNSEFLFSSPCFWDRGSHLVPLQYRSIFSTAQLQNSWMNKIKGVFTGQKSSQGEAQVSSESFTLLRFADELKKARKIGAFKEYIVGRSSEATFADALEKQEAVIRYLGGLDPTGENLQSGHKQEAAKHCNCTIADVENTLAKFTWAKEAQKKIENLQKEGKPMPKSFAEVQKLMGSSPLDLAKSNLAKSGQISRNALCPCGSKKRYKWYFSVHILLLN
ncbi:NTF2-like domain containing protein [Trema orientale]|uniref:NTF2-like domain containing protein n=1 Tax=Trema orientale TaxID=63057 RepID=A0A2P5D8C3_TREOI|nr:NTF2-like domain containing protein [Trema orientale]